MLIRQWVRIQGVDTYANPDLKPETSDNFEIGARWASAYVSADIAAFYSEADDYITTLRVSDSEYRYSNAAEAKTFGIELTSSVRIAETGFEPYLTATDAPSIPKRRRLFNV